MIALIDADIIAYKAVHAKTKTIDWEDGEEPSGDVDLPGAKRMALEIVDAWTQGSGATSALLCFSDREANFRKKVCPWYKSNRGDHTRPPEVDEVEAYLESKLTSLRLPTLEADDVMGLAMSDTTIAVTIDKDLKTVPGLLWNPDKDVERPPIKILPGEADWWFMFQTLTGDRVDGYFGAPGIGPKKAEAILGTNKPGYRIDWDAIIDAYYEQWNNRRWCEKFQTDDPEGEALINARCARILRAGEYNEETEEVTLWNP